ncbi:MAG: fumarylacetoacetate hydrolase family protein [Colwellia sp.]
MNTITLLSTEKVSLGNSRQLITPSKIVCIGRNYVEHIQELANDIPDEMVVFLKPNSAMSTDLHAKHNEDVLHYEAELSFLYQGGQFTAVALGLDLTKRDVQNKLKAKGLPWERAKAFDGSAVFSDFIRIEQQDISQLNLSLTLNGVVKQLGGVSLMMVKPEETLAELQSFLTLEDGDIIMTGTPKGVGVIKPLDRFVGQVFLSESDPSVTNCSIKNNSASNNPAEVTRLLDCQWQAQ